VRPTTRRYALLVPTLLGVFLRDPSASAQPNTSLASYVLFADTSLRIRSATIQSGNVGVNNGLLNLTRTVVAPSSEFVADFANLETNTVCKTVYANTLTNPGAGCPRTVGAVPRPLIPNLASACAFPPPIACNPALPPLIVSHNQLLELKPTPANPNNVYGDLVVQGGGAGAATLKLAGDYTFCNIRVGRNGNILFTGPSTVRVQGSVRFSNASAIGPNPGSGAPLPGEIRWFVQGSQVHMSRKGDIAFHLCAPNGRLSVGSGVGIRGHYVASTIRVRKGKVDFTPPVPGVCGDTVVSPGEQCEQDADCPGGSCVACSCGPTTTTTTSTTTTTTLPRPCETDEDCDSSSGVFICEDGHCVPGCDDDEDCRAASPTGAFVCEDGRCVPGSTTTTTTSVPGSTTTTTLRPCTTDDDCPIGVCREGFCVPECEDDEDCREASPTGAFVCLDGRCVQEVCGDCVDNDRDGSIDFEDPDCCDANAGQLYAMDIQKGRIRPRGGSQARLRLKGLLASGGIASRIDPVSQRVSIQIRSLDTGEVLCARIPAGKFVKKRKTFRFRRKKAQVPVELARNLDRVVIKLRRNGQMAYKVRGKRTELTTPPEGTLRITVGFSPSESTPDANVCSQAVRVFRGGKKGQVRFP